MSSRAIFRWCMVGAALIIGGVALYFLMAYVTAAIAIANSGLKPFYQQAARAMWIGYCAQLGVLAAVLLYAAAVPRGISRQAVIVLALMPAISTVNLFWSAASRAGAVCLGIAAALMVVGALFWPRPAPSLSPPEDLPAA